MNEKIKSEEISFLDLTDKIFTNLYIFILRRYKIIASFTFIGLLTSILFVSIKWDTYVAKILATTNSYYEVNEIINSLTPFSQNKKKLAQILDIPQNEILNLREISSDTTENHLIDIKIIFKKELDLAKIEKKIVNYIENNDYLAKSYSSKRKKQETLKIQLQSEIDELDSLQRIIMTNLKNESHLKSNDKVIIKNEKVDFYHNDILSRKKEILKADSLLNHLKPLDIIKPCSIKESYYSIPIVVLVLTFLFFVMGTFIAIFQNYKERLIKK